jgi:hypothetical protein
MSKIRKHTIVLVAFLLTASGLFYTALADHDGHGEERRHQERHRNHSEHDDNRHLAPVSNPTYKENCGACHFAYQPELLPSGSWHKILAGLEDHFGESIELDPASKKIIAEYLEMNAAEHSSAKRAIKIMKSLGNQTPLRITQIPYIQRKHHEIQPDVLERESIGSLSNCIACHKTAERGIYEDDDVVVPK